MKEILEKIQNFCGEYGFYFAIAAAALLLIWLITWIALGIKCRKLKKKNKALYTANAEYIRADEQRATEAARAAVVEKQAAELPAAVAEPTEDERLAALLAEMDEDDAPAESVTPAPAADVREEEPYDEEFDITAMEDETAAEPKDEKAPKEMPVNYVVKYDRAKLSWIITKKGSQRVVRRVQTKEEALRVARELCKRTGAGLYVHKKDGKFQKI